MTQQQYNPSLFNKHLLERATNAAISTCEWQALRLRQRQETDEVGLMFVGSAHWARQQKEVTDLGISQQGRLSLLLDRHRVESAGQTPFCAIRCSV